MCYIVPIMPSIYLAARVFSLMGMHNNSARIIVRTIFMENIPNEIMGRVQTIFGVYTRAMVVLSSLYVGWLIENHSIELAVFSPQVTLLLHSLARLLSSLFGKEIIRY